MANYSPITYTGTGAQTNFAVSWPYLDQSHVSVLVNGSPRSFTWVDAGTIQISPAPVSGASVSIIRTTPGDVLVNFAAGFVRSSDQNYAYKQPLFRADEVQAQAQAGIDAVNALLASGKIIRSGAGAPSNGLGNDGDFYINTTSWLIYGPKVSGSWPSGVSLIGAQGPQGAQGFQGPVGPQGAQGPQGNVGPQGNQGPTGPQGNQGFQGPTGPQGNQGFQGPTGATGATSTVPGPQGSIGPQGPAGPTGATGAASTVPGPQGPAGANGTGTGDVVGPASATTDHIVLFDGATGKLIKSSGTLLSALLASSSIGSTVQGYSAELNTIAGLTTNGLLRRSGGVWTVDTTTYLTSLGIGSLTQAWDADLDAIAALATTGVLRRTGASAWGLAAETGTGSVVFGTGPTLTNPFLSSSVAVTAGTNAQGQGALTADVNIITTTAANPSGVTLPTPAAGRVMVVINRGTNPINVYPPTGCSIDALAVNGSMPIAAGGSLVYWGQSATVWQSSVNQMLNMSYATSGTLLVTRGGTGVTVSTGSGSNVLGTAPALSAVTYSLAAAVTSGTNAQGQGALTSDINIVTTNAAAPGGVTLPTATAGRMNVLVVNRTANPLAVFPATGASIDGRAANASVWIPAGCSASFSASSTTAWFSDQSMYSTIGENAQTGTTYTLALNDSGLLVSLSNAAAIALTIPTNATVPFPIGTRIDLLQGGAGQVTIGGAGVTIQSAGSRLKLTGQWSGATLYKRGTDTWALIGDIAT